MDFEKLIDVAQHSPAMLGWVVAAVLWVRLTKLQDIVIDMNGNGIKAMTEMAGLIRGLRGSSQ